MIDRAHALPVSRQTKLLGIARSSTYYLTQPVSHADQLLMRRIDELHMEFLSAEARMRARPLRRDTDHGSQGGFNRSSRAAVDGRHECLACQRIRGTGLTQHQI